MRRTILLGLALFIFLSTEAFASRPLQGRLDRHGRGGYTTDRMARYGRLSPNRIRGKRGRKYARRFSLRDNLVGDKLRIYETYGYTPHRLGFNVAGRRTERWKYFSQGLEFVFDQEGNLLSTREFEPEGNHID